MGVKHKGKMHKVPKCKGNAKSTKSKGKKGKGHKQGKAVSFQGSVPALSQPHHPPTQCHVKLSHIHKTWTRGMSKSMPKVCQRSPPSPLNYAEVKPVKGFVGRREGKEWSCCMY